MDLDMVDLRAGAHARGSQALQLLAVRQHEARIADLDIAQPPGTVSILRAAVNGVAGAFGVARAGGCARRGGRTVASGYIRPAEPPAAPPPPALLLRGGAGPIPP